MRKTYLDNIRWITVLLVVIYHTIYIYNGVQTYGVVGPFAKIQYQDAIQYLLYPWFMVLLFVVAGMSSRYYLMKHTDKEFMRSRTRKLLVPSTIGIAIFGWIQGYYNMAISNAFETMNLDQIPKPILVLIMDLSGTGVLWFIQLLWVFSVLLIWVRKIEKDRLYGKCKKAGIVVLLALTVVIYLFAQILNTPVITVYRFGIYGVSFFIGYFILSHDEVQERLARFYIPLSVAAVVFGIAYTVIYFGENYAVEPVINNVLACVYAWIMTLALLAFMKVKGGKETTFGKWMNCKSWGLYIFHYLPLSMVAFYMSKYASNAPAILFYLLTFVASFFGGIAIYEVVKRIPFVRWCLLGMKKEQ